MTRTNINFTTEESDRISKANIRKIVHWLPLTKSKNIYAKDIVYSEQVLIVTKLFNITVNDSDAKKSFSL